LDFIHLSKTAAMIEASLVIGGLIGGADESRVETLRTAGRHLGFAFQITDDILDATADTATLGKTAGKDAKAGKTTYVALHGLPSSHTIADQHTELALKSISRIDGPSEFLSAVITAVARRTT
jgi:geranylgeranyl pyrophosphate synthase